MKYFSLTNTPETTQWRFGLSDEEERRTTLLKRYKHDRDKFWEFEEPLTLELWYQDLGIPSYADLGYCDIHQWIGNQMNISPILNGKPAGYLLIMSDGLKKIFDSFTIPNHKFYGVDGIKRNSGERRGYYILHLLNERYQHLDFSKVGFIVKKRKTILKTFEPGVITSYAHLLETSRQESEQDPGAGIEDTNLVYNSYYDVLWGDSTEILISEIVKEKIEQSGLKGVAFNQYHQDIQFT